MYQENIHGIFSEQGKQMTDPRNLSHKGKEEKAGPERPGRKVEVGNRHDKRQLAEQGKSGHTDDQLKQRDLRPAAPCHPPFFQGIMLLGVDTKCQRKGTDPQIFSIPAHRHGQYQRTAQKQPAKALE